MVSKRGWFLVLAWFFVFLWMVLIFNFSAQPAQHSDDLSRGVTEKAVETVEKIAPGKELSIDRINHLLRKNAHFFIYLILAVLLMNALLRSGVTGVQGFMCALGICILYAISDEWHQLFVSGRGAQAKDVFIDSTGALVGIVIYQLIKKISRRLTF